MSEENSLSALVLRIEKSSMHDGAGLRTVVFLKGCNLRCLWCSTPESQNMREEFGYGRLMSVEETLAQVLKDEVFYFHSGGGLTVSGGEPLLQADFVAALLQSCKRHGVNTALETSFNVPWAQIEPLLPYLDTLFVDVKHSDSTRHRELTGAGNEEVLTNIRQADAAPQNFAIIVRVPLLPGLNDGADNLRQTAAFAASLNKLRGLELLPYHRLGVATYAKLGREYALAHIPTPSAAYLAEKKRLIQGFQPELNLI